MNSVALCCYIPTNYKRLFSRLSFTLSFLNTCSSLARSRERDRPCFSLQLTDDSVVIRPFNRISVAYIYMPRRDTKPTKWYVRPAKTQINLGWSPGWSESSLGAQIILLVLSGGGSHRKDGCMFVKVLCNKGPFRCRENFTYGRIQFKREMPWSLKSRALMLSHVDTSWHGRHDKMLKYTGLSLTFTCEVND